MINKNIKKLLSKDKIKLLKNLNLKSRPSEIRPEIFIRLLNYMRLEVKFVFSVIIIFSICLKQTSKFLLIRT